MSREISGTICRIAIGLFDNRVKTGQPACRKNAAREIITMFLATIHLPDNYDPPAEDEDNEAADAMFSACRRQPASFAKGVFSAALAILASMKRLLGLFFAAGLALSAYGQTRVQDVVYLNQGGTALTMDVFEPAKPNGAGVIYMVSGAFYSNRSMIDPGVAKLFTDQGLTVFAVVHGSQPKYMVPEILTQVRHAVRFIHSVAAQYNVNPKRLGVAGISSGGHLTLMLAGTGDPGNPSATDPVDRESSELKAAVAIAPPADFLNWGSPQHIVFAEKNLAMLLPAFGMTPQTPVDKVTSLAHDLSPIHTVTDHFPITLLVHGDSDMLVPIQQSEEMDAELEKHHIKHMLMIVPGGGHDEKTFVPGVSAAAKWFLDNLYALSD
jgi:acetyl esterase/lipase